MINKNIYIYYTHFQSLLFNFILFRTERPEYREGEPKYDDDRLVDDFGRDLARRKLSLSHHSPDKDIDPRDKLSPSLISDRDRRDRDVPDEDLESRRREKARSHSRSRSKERRSSSRSH